MNDGYAWWLVLVGLAIGLALMWLALARLPLAEDDIDVDGRDQEGYWIAGTIESRGGICPQPLAVEVLELHHDYLESSGGRPTLGSQVAAAAQEPPTQ